MFHGLAAGPPTKAAVLLRNTPTRAYAAAVTDHTRRRVSALALALSTALATTILAPAGASVASVAHPSRMVHGDAAPAVTDLGPTSFTELGPYSVGETTLRLKTNKAPVEVWYPTTRRSVAGRPQGAYDMVSWLPDYLKDRLPAGFALTYPSGGVRGVPVAPGRFPLLVFSHGYAGFRDQSSFLTAWLASWGFVVAAPDHYSRDLTKILLGPAAAVPTTDVGDLRSTINLMSARNTKPKKRFYRHLDLRRIGAVGHSAGGAAVEALAAVDHRVKTFVSLAGASVGAFGEAETGPFSKVPKVPGLLMAATSDGVVNSADMIAAYRKLHKPKRLVLVGGGHHAFSDICEVGAAEGGLLAVAALVGIPLPDQLKLLATDGCDPPALPPTEIWPAIRQTVVAHLRYVFGFDDTRAGLTGLVDAFPGIVSGSRSAG